MHLKQSLHVEDLLCFAFNGWDEAQQSLLMLVYMWCNRSCEQYCLSENDAENNILPLDQSRQWSHQA